MKFPPSQLTIPGRLQPSTRVPLHVPGILGTGRSALPTRELGNQTAEPVGDGTAAESSRVRNGGLEEQLEFSRRYVAI